MEPKFKHGDLVIIRSSKDQVMVIEYKINRVGNVANYLQKTNQYPENILTDEVLCEGVIAGKFQRKYIKEANLELVQ
jgi:hypothetical protein